MDKLPDIGQEILPNSSFLISFAAGHNPLRLRSKGKKEE
jgi:hypothetical protein